MFLHSIVKSISDTIHKQVAKCIVEYFKSSGGRKPCWLYMLYMHPLFSPAMELEFTNMKQSKGSSKTRINVSLHVSCDQKEPLPILQNRLSDLLSGLWKERTTNMTNGGRLKPRLGGGQGPRYLCSLYLRLYY